MKCKREECKMWNKTTNDCGDLMAYGVDDMCYIDQFIIWHKRKIEEYEKIKEGWDKER